MPTYARLCLQPGETLRIDADENLELVCEFGEFWLSTGGGSDHHLQAGEATACPPGRLLLEGRGTLLLRPGLRQSRYPSRWRRGSALSRLALHPAAPLPAFPDPQKGH